MNLRDSVIIVTGSATGLGSAVVKQVAAKGARVIINYTKSEKEARETEAVCDYLGVESILCKADVSVDEDCRRMAQEAMDRWGRIDGLVNNAAMSVFANSRDLEALTGQQFLDVMSVNLVGPYQMVRAVAPYMKAQGTGSIVNVSSISALTGAGSSIAYAASKGALNTMTLSLARSLAPEIKVNAVLPSAFPSRWWPNGLGEEAAEALFEKFNAQVPLGEVATPDSVARTVVWLLEDAAYTTGEMLKIDSGMHLLGFQP
ncbi:MAG TPA: oxidoreductase [Dehalococcoidia bacterium]|nr:oxidoreductase [Chloroflexota bacterium]MQF94732.1 SDR family oxidoreductase [SAR202 cluster bacterium]HAA94583.1 oxidoreductase [Dehalococcoidia bacterium]HCL25311.1 oxidoreductase [Dehalococcoidia bacterium]|tara:strand:- start:985 stop:1761 length:777 start_codon:yes stop_codon:yes gene_type:complete